MNVSHNEDIDALLRRQFEGPVVDDGFSERVMLHLPARGRHTSWPLWLGILIGTVACWSCLAGVPPLHIGWRDWLAGELSTSAIGMWLAMAAMSFLALGWGLAESRNR